MTPEVVTAYSAMELDELADYAAGVAAAHPDVRLRVVRMSTAALRERLLADGAWDVIFGWALSALRDPRVEALLGPVEVSAALPAGARDPAGRWFCPSAFVPAFCLNDARLAVLGLPRPRSWADLADPRFRGEVVVPDPNHSGAGFLHLTALLQSGDPHAGWSVLRRVAANRPRVERSSSVPCQLVADGVAAVGVTVTTAAHRACQLSPALGYVFPTDAARTEPEVFAVRLGCPRREAALRVLAWTLTPPAAAIYAKYHKLALAPDSAGLSGVPPLAPVDIDRAVRDRKPALRLWSAIFAPDPTP